MISRNDLIEQSVYDFVRESLTANGYSEDFVAVQDAFPYNDPNLSKNVVATGFAFDDGGRQAELGSSLKRTLHTVQFWVFGRSPHEARNLASVVSGLLDAANDTGGVPLRDYGQDGNPEIDKLITLEPSYERQIIPDPEPWQESVYTATCRLEDTAYASVV